MTKKEIEIALKEWNKDEFKRIRLKLITDDRLVDALKKWERSELVSVLNDVFDADDLIEIIETYINMDDIDLEILNYMTYHYDFSTSMYNVKNQEYSLYEDAADFAGQWIENCTPRDGIRGILSAHMGDYMASKIVWSIDYEDLGKDMIKDGESTYQLSDGTVIDIYL